MVEHFLMITPPSNDSGGSHGVEGREDGRSGGGGQNSTRGAGSSRKSAPEHSACRVEMCFGDCVDGLLRLIESD